MNTQIVQIRNIVTGEEIDVHATTEHPDSSYHQPVWVDENGQSYGQIGLPMLGYEIIELEKKE